MDPQQELFSAMLEGLRKIYDVYDGELPDAGASYPFIYLGDCQQVDDTNKGGVFGNVFLTVHVWHNQVKERGTVSQMLLDVKNIARKLQHTDNFAWDLRNVDQQIYPDETTRQPLLHGVLNLEFKFS